MEDSDTDRVFEGSCTGSETPNKKLTSGVSCPETVYQEKLRNPTFPCTEGVPGDDIPGEIRTGEPAERAKNGDRRKNLDNIDKQSNHGDGRFERCFQGSTTSMDGGGYLNTRPYSAGLPRARSPIISSVSDISRPVMTSSITASLDGESETEMSQLLNRTRQKKFIKNFKQLPSEELVLQRYSCALVGDILLQGHLYVTENYIAFHSNVFGYITRIEIPMLSVSGITKEKTAKIIPNAVGVTTLEETHIFSSLISREGTFKVMTKAWKKALAKHNLTTLNGVIENGDEDEDDGVDRELVDEESTDSMVSASQILPIGLPRQPELDSRSPFLMKRVSNTSGALFYQARTSPPPPPTLTNSKEGIPKINGKLSRVIFSLLSLPTHSKFLSFLTLLLFLLLCTSFYLVFRLDSIQEKVEAFLPSYPGNLEQISSWQKVLHSQSNLQVDQYLQSNLHQLAKVRENLDRLSSLLHVKEKDEFR